MCRFIWFFFVVSQVAYAELDTLNKKPFFGYFAGQKNSTSLYKLGADGYLEAVLLKNRGDKVSMKPIELRFFLEERGYKDPSRWINKRFKEESFESVQEPTTKPGDVVFTAIASNRAKIRVTLSFKKDEVFYGIELLESKKTSREMRMGFDVMIPPIHRYIEAESERDLKRKTKGSRMKILRKDGEEVKIPLYRKPKEVFAKDLDLLKSGVRSLEIESKEFGKSKVEIVINEKGNGVFIADGASSKRIYKGFRYRILVDPTLGGSGFLGSFKANR